ncbi:MAG: DUF1501 domain-containing protein [Pirellulales bacterium]
MVVFCNGGGAVWTTEFGRTPYHEKADHPGREHHHQVFASWMAGGGVKSGIVYGSSDEYGVAVGENRVHDFHATILHLLGLDHEKLTFRHAGRRVILLFVRVRLVYISRLQQSIGSCRQLFEFAARSGEPQRGRGWTILNVGVTSTGYTKAARNVRQVAD